MAEAILSSLFGRRSLQFRSKKYSDSQWYSFSSKVCITASHGKLVIPSAEKFISLENSETNSDETLSAQRVLLSSSRC